MTPSGRSSARLILGIALLFGFLTNITAAYALPIQVLSQEYSIGGEGWVRCCMPTPFPTGRVSYSFEMTSTSASPVSQNIGFTPDNSLGILIMIARAGGEVTQDSASLAISSRFQDLGDALINKGYARASMTFSPLESSLRVSVPEILPDFLNVKGTINNVTDDSLLFSAEAPSSTPALLTFNVGQVYRMTLASEGPYPIFSTGLMRIEAVPEAPPLSLLGLGIAWIVGMRRQFTANGFTSSSNNEKEND